jgi:ATP-dependent DNA helicase RecQ
VNGKLSGKFNDVQFYFLVLLLWSYEHFAYNRRQSLKNVYEQCSALAQRDISSAEFKSALESYFSFNESSNIIQHIADKPHEYERWFDLFYTIRNNKRTDELVSLETINELKDQLSRFLESYMNNVGLDLLSGLIRLSLDDFDDVDGQQRFVSALKKIKDYDLNTINHIMDKILGVTSRLTKSQKGGLVASIHNVFNDNKIIDKFYRSYEDNVSLSILLKSQIDRLATISNKLKDSDGRQNR